MLYPAPRKDAELLVMMFALPTSPLMSIRELLLWPKVALLPWCVSEADELLLSVQSRSWAAISAFVSRPLLLKGEPDPAGGVEL